MNGKPNCIGPASDVLNCWPNLRFSHHMSADIGSIFNYFVGRNNDFLLYKYPICRYIVSVKPTKNGIHHKQHEDVSKAYSVFVAMKEWLKALASLQHSTELWCDLLEKFSFDKGMAREKPLTLIKSPEWRRKRYTNPSTHKHTPAIKSFSLAAVWKRANTKTRRKQWRKGTSLEMITIHLAIFFPCHVFPFSYCIYCCWGYCFTFVTKEQQFILGQKKTSP